MYEFHFDGDYATIFARTRAEAELKLKLECGLSSERIADLMLTSIREIKPSLVVRAKTLVRRNVSDLLERLNWNLDL
jgi:hypothetical protein